MKVGALGRALLNAIGSLSFSICRYIKSERDFSGFALKKSKFLHAACFQDWRQFFAGVAHEIIFARRPRL